MADIVPDEGLDYLLGIFPKNGSNLATSYLLLFQGLTSTTVPGASSVLNTHTGITEPSFGGYARVSVASTDWGSISAGAIWSITAARKVTAAQKSFPAATGTYATAINGFGLGTALTGGTGLYYSNFDDTTDIPSLGVGDVIKVTPTFGLGGQV